MLHDMDKYIFDTYKLKVIYSVEIVELISSYYDMFEKVVIPVWQETGIEIPFPEICFVEKEALNGFSFMYQGRYYIVIYSGVLTLYKRGLQERFSKRGKNIADGYLAKLHEYAVLFVVMHEYMHMFCGHCLGDNDDKMAKEVEADIEAVNFIVKKILQESSSENVENELITSFIGIFYFFKFMEAFSTDEKYNVALLENHYDEKGRDHPLTSQRVLYIYKCYNVFLYNEEKNVFYQVKDRIIDKLLEMGEKQKESSYMDNMYVIEEDKIEELQKEVEQLRIKIPRMGKFENTKIKEDT